MSLKAPLTIAPSQESNSIPSGEVQLWLIPLGVAQDQLLSLERILSQDERDRAQRFRFAETKRRFVVRRAALRQILGQVLSLCPEQIRFERTKFGKPFLSNETRNGPLHLNLSHSGDLAAVALSRAGELGVDIESVRPIEEMLAIAERYFTEAEVATLSGLSTPEQALEYFYRCWCQKEAFLKAKGCGLSGIEATSSDPASLADHYCHAFAPADRVVGALCTFFRPTNITELVFRHEMR